MDPGTNLDVYIRERPLNRLGAADRASRPGKRHEEPIAGRFDLCSSEVRDLRARHLMVSLEERSPARVAESGSTLRRGDDVREEYGGKRSLGLACVPRARQKLLDFTGDGVGIAQPRRVVRPADLEDLCPGDPIG